MMKYKGYTGHVEYDDEAKIFHGDVLGIKDKGLREYLAMPNKVLRVKIPVKMVHSPNMFQKLPRMK